MPCTMTGSLRPPFSPCLYGKLEGLYQCVVRAVLQYALHGVVPRAPLPRPIRLLAVVCPALVDRNLSEGKTIDASSYHLHKQADDYHTPRYRQRTRRRHCEQHAIFCVLSIDFPYVVRA
jgi:hypothetical protein